jgi:hypothetical protein
MVLSKWGFRKLTPFLAIVVAAVCAFHCVLSVADKYHRAQYRLSLYRQELQGWDACRVTRPAFFRANTEEVNDCLRNLAKAEEDSWVSLAKGQLAGLYLLAGLAGAAGGCLVTWAVVQLAGLAVGTFIRLRAYVLRHDTGEQVKRRSHLYPS